MSDAILTLPRRLAIQILHEAQIAQPQAIHGWVLARDGEAAALRVCSEAEARAAAPGAWARLWSHPTSPAEPDLDELQVGVLHLLISLNTKGVLEMRAWELHGGAAREREIKVRD